MNPSNLFQLLRTAAAVAPVVLALEEAETNASLSPADKKVAVLTAVQTLDGDILPLLGLPANMVSVLENQSALSFAYDLITEGVAFADSFTHKVP